MTIINVASTLQYDVQTPTSFLFLVSVATNDHQQILQENISASASGALEPCNVGGLGNRHYRVLAQPGALQLSYNATVNLAPDAADTSALGEAPYSDLPAEVLVYLNPSRYCESDRLNRFAARQFGNCLPGYSRVSDICDWIFDQFAYVTGVTDSSSTACDVLVQRAGVCRDFAHVGISLCRALGIPARYVSGYAVDLQPPDFHGFFEAYLADNWYLFDATELAPVAGFVRIGTGRDAADASFCTTVGNAILSSMEVFAQIRTDDGA